ncbi:MAG: glutamate--cysteine ligase [Thiotrichales bacterium]|nr:MAG: glutamate--cysteine ligase [Thiotrichales bacterium]
MGEEIKYSRFVKTDYQQYEKRLQQETELLSQWFNSDSLSKKDPVAGYELEAWLIDDQASPCPRNDTFLDQVDSPYIFPELARFNVELNVDPQSFNSSLLSDFDKHLQKTWSHCQNTSKKIGCNMLGIGILPTLTNSDLSLENISSLDRYRALNEQVLRQRQGKTIRLNINGNEHLEVEHKDVMLEAAATSLQIHLQTPQHLAVRYYNASVILSAPLVAVGANAPFLFNRDLWYETRIPVFEQSVDIGGIGGAASGPIHRVTFGSQYARESLFECFNENQQHYPVLLPVTYESEPEQLNYLRLHNGTIWRWNRPLIGFDPDGTPHLRIEHRTMSSAASITDNIANIAFYYGLVQYYSTCMEPPESLIPFAEAKDNFYRSAQIGLNHRLRWTDDNRYTIKELVLNKLLPEARIGLEKLGISDAESAHYLGVIESRIKTEQTGSQWQRKFAELHDRDMRLLTRNYYHNQQHNRPVHEWDFESCV